MDTQKRYAVALQTADDPNKYKDIFQTDSEKDAISNAKGSAEKNKRKTWVFDRTANWIIHRFPEATPEKVKKIEQEVIPEKKKRGRPKKVVEVKPPEKKKWVVPDKNAFFE
jgi:hypothetical protein